MRAELIPILGGPAIPITRDITLIGRREYCDIQLDDPSLSKRHCVLVKTDGLLIVRDLATTNGTRVKGQMIRWAALLPNDQITFGKVRFRVFLGPDGSRPPPEGKASKAAHRREVAAKVASPAPLPTVEVAADERPWAVNQPVPRDDVDDSRWFDRMGSAERGEEFIDLD